MRDRYRFVYLCTSTCHDARGKLAGALKFKAARGVLGFSAGATVAAARGGPFQRIYVRCSRCVWRLGFGYAKIGGGLSCGLGVVLHNMIFYE